MIEVFDVSDMEKCLCPSPDWYFHNLLTELLAVTGRPHTGVFVLHSLDTHSLHSGGLPYCETTSTKGLDLCWIRSGTLNGGNSYAITYFALYIFN